MRILVVDDEKGMLEVCAKILRKVAGAEVAVESHSREALKRVSGENFDLLITDIYMPNASGVELLRTAREHDPNLAVLIMTAFPSVETAVECMKLGAADYITKPFLPEDLLATARRLLEAKRLEEENVLLRRQVERAYAMGELLGQSSAMQTVFSAVERIAETSFDVLIAGETGTGKELVARAIHQRSRRCDKPFVPVDCGAIPDELMESEFFGHERGAFTGAHARRLGLLEFASGGSFFLDEIAQLPGRLQAKLLRVLQERKIRRVGGTAEVAVDVRVIAATSADLEEEVRRQTFRLDLFHRINVTYIHVPPLRERGRDIALLANHFLARNRKEAEHGPAEIDSEALDVLSGYPWPGNVRELQNVIRRLVAVVRHPTITVDDLPDEIIARASSTRPDQEDDFYSLRERRIAVFEREYLCSLLASFHGDVSSAAREARLPRSTLYRLLQKHGLDAGPFRQA